jgi:hypothetical protein
VTFQPLVARRIHDAHPAFAELACDGVVPDPRGEALSLGRARECRRKRRCACHPLIEGTQPSPGRAVDRLVRHGNRSYPQLAECRGHRVRKPRAIPVGLGEDRAWTSTKTSAIAHFSHETRGSTGGSSSPCERPESTAGRFVRRVRRSLRTSPSIHPRRLRRRAAISRVFGAGRNAPLVRGAGVARPTPSRARWLS